MNSSKNVKTYKITRVLLQKAGAGPFDPIRIEKAQKYIDSNKVNFTTLGKKHQTELKEALDELEGNLNSNNFESQKHSLILPVMHLKAHAGFFNYPLITELGSIALDFLESLKALDKKSLKVISYFHEMVDQIFEKEMTGKLSSGSTDMVSNLTNSCAEYKKSLK